jgi:hypothetical protein
MCRICDDAKKLSADHAKALKLIGDAIKAGKPAEHFKATLDKLLGTEEPEIDEDKDNAFERAYRGR